MPSFSVSIFSDFDTKVQPVQKFTASAKIHGFREFREFVIFV